MGLDHQKVEHCVTVDSSIPHHQQMGDLISERGLKSAGESRRFVGNMWSQGGKDSYKTLLAYERWYREKGKNQGREEGEKP